MRDNHNNTKMRDRVPPINRFPGVSTCSLFLLVFFFIVIAGPGDRVYGESQVSISVSDNLATIGDQIHIKIIVKTTDDIGDIDVEIPKGGKYEVLREQPPQKRQQTGFIVFEKTAVVAFFNLGEFEIGPFTVKLLRSGEVVETKKTNFVPVTIKSVLTEADKDIKPLKNPIDIKGNPFYVLKYVLLALGIILLVVLIIMWFKQRKKRVPPAPEPLLSPLEEFEKRIMELWEKKLFDKGKMKFHFIELTRILKHFLLRNYRFNAEDFTSEETLFHLKRNEPETVIQDNMRFVMNTSDLVKFAKFVPDSSVLWEVFNKIKDMIGSYKRRAAGSENRQEDTP